MRLRRLAFDLALALACPVALAQWSPPPTMDLGLGMAPIGLDPALLSPVRPASGATLTLAVTPPLSPALQARCAKNPTDAACRRAARPPNLVFKPSPAVSRKVMRELVNDLARRNPDLQAAQLETQLTLSDLKRQFDALLRLHGSQPANLGDVVAAYLVLAWECYSGEIAPPEVWVALSRQWRRELRRTALATRPEAQQQALAESLAWRAMLAAGAARQARRQAAPQLALMREGMRIEVQRATGIDLSRGRLTERGFMGQ